MKSETRDMIRRCRHPLELRLLTIAAIISVTVFLLALGASFFHDQLVDMAQVSAVEDYHAAHPESASLSDDDVLKKLSGEERELIDALQWLHWPIVLLAPAALVLYMLYFIGSTYGESRANGVKIGPNQYPEVWAMWVDMAAKMDMNPPPELYVRNGNGLLNAFATCVPGWRAYSVVYSDLLERCLANQDWASLRFILGHEMGHVRLNHVRWWYNLLAVSAGFAGLNFVLGQPLSRSREYGCDKLGACMAGEGAHRGLLMLAAGKQLYGQVNFQQYLDDHVRQTSRWDLIYNFFNTHPNINWRVRALVERRAGHLMHAGGTTKPDPQ
ncbi:M48 family metallopeptidase [Amphibiibacter pelophylacis]|uniref:M48 family metallopeptidase n=1 Tax=Amphibiibacter pelophylacis TaxID=1799477 RepID=A0ACC6NZG4_9BURK